MFLEQVIQQLNVAWFAKEAWAQLLAVHCEVVHVHLGLDLLEVGKPQVCKVLALFRISIVVEAT